MVWLLGQATVNMAVVTGLAPVVGIPLPFISYGGSALLMSLCAIGVVLSLARAQMAPGLQPTGLFRFGPAGLAASLRKRNAARGAGKNEATNAAKNAARDAAGKTSKKKAGNTANKRATTAKRPAPAAAAAPKTAVDAASPRTPAPRKPGTRNPAPSNPARKRK
jgi:cell division protein FtsW